MQSEGKVYQIPYGTRDFLPMEAAEKRHIETALAEFFSVWGYDEIVTPTIEYAETLLTGNGQALEPHMFKFFDKENRTVALRHEMTTPIARVVASRLADEALPLKLSYVSNVFRYEQAQTGRQCEFNQAGIEFVGAASVMADSEVLALAVKSLEKVGLSDFQVCLGQVDFVNGLMEQFGLSAGSQWQIKTALERHDLVGLANIADSLQLSDEDAVILKRLPLLHGGREIIDEAYGLVRNEKSRRALDNLVEISNLLEVYGVTSQVQIDLDVIRDFNYYTGMVFEVYTPGLGCPICGGGRYDNMLKDFGTDCPATGFAIGIERVMLALEQHGLATVALKKGCYVAYAEGKADMAITKAEDLRKSGQPAVVAPASQTEKEAIAYQHLKGYKELVYIQ